MRDVNIQQQTIQPVKQVKQEQGLCKTGVTLLYTALLQHDMKFVVGDAMIYCSVLRVGYVRTECDWRKTMLARVMDELSYNLCHIWNDWLQDTPLHPADIPQGSSFIQGFIASGMSAFRCEKEIQLIFCFMVIFVPQYWLVWYWIML